jgi:RES domain-containing protein
MIEYADSVQLRAHLRRCLDSIDAWTGTVYRFAAVKFANRADLLSGAGAKLHGGRWSPRGRFACVYASLDAHTAQEESFATFAYYGIPRNMVMPLVQIAIALRLKAVLDLSSNETLQRLGLTREEFADCDWQREQSEGREALTQCIGRLAWEARVEAIMVPSRTVADGANLVLFPGRRRTGCSWRIQGVRKLPPKAY